MSKVISLTDDDHYTAWQVPELQNSLGVAAAHTVKTESVKQISATTPVDSASGATTDSQRFEEAYRKGFEEGLKQSSGSHDLERKQLVDIVQAMTRPLEQVNESVESELVELSLAVAKMILRREINDDQRLIVGLIQAALKQLPSSSLNIRIHLHPEDAVVVRDALAQAGQVEHWQIDEDSAMGRGDCQIHTDNSFIDAGIDGLIARLAADMIGSQRSTDMNENQDHVTNKPG